MPRAKRGVKARRRRNKIMKAAKGNTGSRRTLWRPTTVTVMRGWAYAYRDRRARKRDFRKLWIVRINAAARLFGTSYSRLIGWLKKANVELDRKVLADLAVRDLDGFRQIVDQVRPS